VRTQNLGKGSGKHLFSRGGSIETAGFQGAKRRVLPSEPRGGSEGESSSAHQ